MPKRILVPLDRTPEAEAVLSLVADLARGGGATVRLMTVAPAPDNVVDTDGRVIAYADQEATRLEADGLDYLRTQEIELDGVPVERVVQFGEPVEQIVREAEVFGADLIAMTAGRHNRLSQAILGGTAQRVCRWTPVPVFILRPRIDGRA